MAISALLVSTRPLTFAQSSSRLAFDVASVRVASPSARPSQRITDSRADFINTPMRLILFTAFGLTALSDYQLVAPSWVDTTRIDIQATIPAGRSRRDVPAMLKTLLIDRFGLMTRIESRVMEVYELRVDKSGLKITEVQPVDELSHELRSDAPKPPTTTDRETVDGPVRTSMIPLGGRTITTRMKYDRIFTERRTQILDATRISIPELVLVLTTNVDRPVLDKTGLTGLYQFKVELPPDARAVRMMIAAGTTTTVKGTPLTDPTGISVFKALEGLGLKLEQRRSPVDVVVVDKLNATPTSN